MIAEIITSIFVVAFLGWMLYKFGYEDGRAFELDKRHRELLQEADRLEQEMKILLDKGKLL